MYVGSAFLSCLVVVGVLGFLLFAVLCYLLADPFCLLCFASVLDLLFLADIAQSVEHFLGKEEVAGSSPVVSSSVLEFFKECFGFKEFSVLVGCWVYFYHKVYII